MFPNKSIPPEDAVDAAGNEREQNERQESRGLHAVLTAELVDLLGKGMDVPEPIDAAGDQIQKDKIDDAEVVLELSFHFIPPGRLGLLDHTTII